MNRPLICPAPFAAYARAFAPVGSRVTCNPAPTDTDIDVLVLLNWRARGVGFLTALNGRGWILGGSDMLDESARQKSPFESWTLGNVNVIATRDEGFYARFLAATSIAKHLNLLRKDDRIALFQGMLYGNAPSGGRIKA